MQELNTPCDGVPRTGVVSVGLVSVLLVSVSVVALPTNVSVLVGSVNVPVLLMLEIIGVVSVLLVKVSVPANVANVPVVGKVTFVVPVRVLVYAKLPEPVTVIAALFDTPVPPLAAGKAPVTWDVRSTPDNAPPNVKLATTTRLTAGSANGAKNLLTPKNSLKNSAQHFVGASPRVTRTRQHFILNFFPAITGANLSRTVLETPNNNRPQFIS